MRLAPTSRPYCVALMLAAAALAVVPADNRGQTERKIAGRESRQLRGYYPSG